MAWDANRQRVVLFGGSMNRRPFAALDDVWEWDGHRWAEVRPQVEMPALHGEMVIFDPQRGSVVALGGGGPGAGSAPSPGPPSVCRALTWPSQPAAETEDTTSRSASGD
jgi:hypothetical protein